MFFAVAIQETPLSTLNVEWPLLLALGLVVLVAVAGSFIYIRCTQQVSERQLRLEAENARRQEQTYQVMVQHYRQAVLEMQSRMDAPMARGGGSVEAVQLLVEGNIHRMARMEARLEILNTELQQLRRSLSECEATNQTLFSSVSDLHHKFNNLNHAVGDLVEVH
jgi:biopolymer transport protein ExbB/TolQ